jgi:alcohol dehydrogenase class IV
MPLNIKGYGVTSEVIPELAKMASQQWTAQFNPRPVAQNDFESLYASALESTRTP